MVVLLLLPGCNSDTKAQEYRQIGSELTAKRSRMQQMSDYDYVANWQTKQYWPNEQRYVDAIPSAYRVYIQDKRTLDDFKGYTEGPR